MKSVFGKYEIIKDVWQIDYECEHPLCERFHKRGCPPMGGVRTEYFVAFVGTLDRVDGTDCYKTKHEAFAEIKWLIAGDLRKAELENTLPTVQEED